MINCQKEFMQTEHSTGQFILHDYLAAEDTLLQKSCCLCWHASQWVHTRRQHNEASLWLCTCR